MYSSALTALLLGAALSATAAPLYPRLTKLDPAAVAEAQPRDDTATRALTATTITTADGLCLNVVSGSGDFRENLAPITPVPCDGSEGQKWDVITAGKHNNVAGQALIVSTLTNACMNFDPRRAAGNQVITFSCGGRADGGGEVTNSQLFAFDPSKTAGVPLVPLNGNGNTVLTITNGQLDQSTGAAAAASGNQLFSFGGSSAAAPPAAPPASSGEASTTATADASSTDDCPAVTVTVTAGASATETTAASATITPPPSSTTAAAAPAASAIKSVALNEEAVAEAMKRDDTATRALTGTAIKTSDGQCLAVDKFSGDFRENLIPVQVLPCDGSDGQKWDVITKGVHNNVAGQALIVSSLTQGCISFDDRRPAGNKVTLFSCGGRADGGGEVTDSQLYAFDAAKTAGVPLVPQNGQNKKVLTVANGGLDVTDGSAEAASGVQLFTFA